MALSRYIGCTGGLMAGFVLGFGTLFVLMLIFGDYEDEPVVAAGQSAMVVEQQPQSVAAVVQPEPTQPPAPVGLTYAEVCDVDESNMTDPQIAAHARSYENQTFTDWQGLVYDVVSRADGTYNLEIAMRERGLFWSRNIVIEDIPTELAYSLNVEQPITFSGRIARIDTTFETMCNPMVVDNYTIQ